MKKLALMGVLSFVVSQIAMAQVPEVVLVEAQKTEKKNGGTTMVKPLTQAEPLIFKEKGTGMSETWIPFTNGFSAALNGKKPFVLISPLTDNQGFYISEITDKGFMVNKSKGVLIDKQFRFNWQAELP